MAAQPVSILQTSTVTVVIPTLGRQCLEDTIRHLNAGTVVPKEILVCIPHSETFRTCHLNVGNVKVLPTDHKGQVYQRAIGFQNATYDFVLQLDDDIQVDRLCLESLLEQSIADPTAAVGALLICKQANDSPYKYNKNSLVMSTYYRLLNGKNAFVPGQISKSGREMGVSASDGGGERIAVEWLPGGCVLHRKHNLYLEDFYSFQGKAYCEDLFHSFYLSQKGVPLAIAPKAQCKIDCISSFASTPRAFYRGLVLEYRARKAFVRLTSRSLLRMHLYYIMVVARYTVGQLSRIPDHFRCLN